MSIRRLVVLAVALLMMIGAANGAETPADLAESVLLSHGDVLHGTFVRADADSIQWKRPAVNEHAAFKIARRSVVGIKLLKPKASIGKNQAKVILGNRDVIYGEILGFDEKGLKLRTDFAGEITVSPGAIALIYPPSGKSEYVMHELGALDDWPLKSGATTKGDAILINSGYIANAVELPDKIHIHVEVSKSRGSNYFSFSAYTGGQARSNDGLTVYLSSDDIGLMRGTSSSLGSSRDHDYLRTVEMFKFDIYMDKTAKKVVVYEGGKEILTSSNYNYVPPASKGFNISVRSYPTTVHKLTIARWDGSTMDTEASTSTVGAKTKHDQAIFMNNDTISGELIGMGKKENEAVMQFKTSYGVISVPLAKVNKLILKTPNQGNQMAGDCHLYFGGSRRITLAITEVVDGNILGTSSSFVGRNIKLDQKYFTGIRFNINSAEAGKRQDEFYKMISK